MAHLLPRHRDMGPVSASTLRQVLVLFAIGLALVAQQLTVLPRQAWMGWMLFAGAAVLFVAAAWPGDEPAEQEPRARTAWRWRRLPWMVAAIGAVAFTTRLSMHNERPLLAFLLWLAAFALASLAWRGSQLSTPIRPAVGWTRRELLLLLAILLLGIAARTLWIDDVPRYYFDDESRVGVFVRNVFRGQFPNLFTMGWNSWPVACMALQGIFGPLIGLSTTALRLSSSLSGSLAILTTYLLARQLFSVRMALLTGVLFACDRTAIDFSRMGITHIQVPLFETFAFACWWHAINRGRGLAYLWTGIGLGLCLLTYNAGQLVPLLWIGWLALTLVFAPRAALRCWRGAALTAAGLVLTVLPYLNNVTDQLTFGRNWQEYTGMARNRQVVSQVVDAWNGKGAADAWAIVQRQGVLTWLGFGVLPADAYALGYRGGGMLDHVSAPLFVLGLAFSLAHLRRPRCAFLVYWWLVTTVMGGVFTQAPPAFVRLVGLLPVLALFGALPLDYALRYTAGPAARRLVYAAVGVMLVVMAWDNWRTYFVAFPRDTSQPSSELARYLAAAPPDTVGLLIGTEHFLQFGTEIYELNFPARKFVNVGEPSQLLPLRDPADAHVALIFGYTQLTLAEYAQTLYPGTAIFDARRGSNPDLMFRAMLLSPAQIAARQGLQLEALDDSGTATRIGVADPFAREQTLPDACSQVRWSGSVYWPTDKRATLAASGGTTFTLAHKTIPSADDGHEVHVELQLPRGWTPLRITDVCHPAQPLAMSLEVGGRSQTILKRDLRPDGADEGLLAVYKRNDLPVLNTVEPNLNCFAVEDLLHPPNDVPLRMPLTVTWNGLLQVDTPGSYEFEAEGTGPYTVTLDGETLFQQMVQTPEEPRRARAKRTLTAGTHPLAAVWDSTRRAHTSRRLFQLYWVPPAGRRELIPPPHFRYLSEGTTDQPLPTLAIPPTPTPIALAAGERVSLTTLETTTVSFGFAPPRINQSWGGPPISVGGIEYGHGIGVHAWCKMTYAVPSNAVAFESIVGLAEDVKEGCTKASVTFEVRDDHENLLYDSGIIDVYAQPKLAHADLKGTRTITLIVTDAGDGIDCDHANWAEPAFVLGQ